MKKLFIIEACMIAVLHVDINYPSTKSGFITPPLSNNVAKQKNSGHAKNRQHNQEYA